MEECHTTYKAMHTKEKLSEMGIAGGNAPKHRYTEEERLFIRREYKHTGESAKQIASVLGVSWLGIRGQVQAMGIAKRTDYSKWNPERDDELRELLGRYAPGTVARKMHLSINAVVVRATRIHLSRRSRDGWYTKKEVCEILGADHHWVQRRIDSGAIKATYHNGSKPRRNGLAMWHIEDKDLRNFIIHYPEELNGRNVDLIQVVFLLVGPYMN